MDLIFVQGSRCVRGRALNFLLMKYLIILDINGTLCCRIQKKERRLVAANPFSPHYDAIINHSHVYLRPFLEEFMGSLSFAHIGLWSSMTGPNTTSFRNLILRESTIFFTFDRSHCSNVRDGKNHSSTKDLSLVYSKFPQFNSENTVIVDDSCEKFLNLENTILIPSYSVISGDPSQDQGNLNLIKLVLPRLGIYLKNLVSSGLSVPDFLGKSKFDPFEV